MLRCNEAGYNSGGAGGRAFQQFVSQKLSVAGVNEDEHRKQSQLDANCNVGKVNQTREHVSRS